MVLFIRCNTVNSLRLNMSESNLEIKEFNCEICSVKCITRRSLRRHQVLKHDTGLSGGGKMHTITLTGMSSLKKHFTTTYASLKDFAPIESEEFNNVKGIKDIRSITQDCDKNQNSVGDDAIKRKLERNYVDALVEHVSNRSELPDSRNILNDKFSRPSKFARRNSKKYKCEVCNKEFCSMKNLLSHVVVHTLDQSTSQAINRSRQDDLILEHIPMNEQLSRSTKCTRRKSKEYLCEVCREKFTSMRNLLSHFVVHTKNQTSLQIINQSRQADLKYVTNEQQSKPPKYAQLNSEHQCKVCDKKFPSTKCLNDHNIVHTGEKNFTCSLCKKKFGFESNLRRHSTSVHENFEKLRCKICAKEFNRKERLSAHMTIHTGLGKFKCSICKKNFGNKQWLLEHLVIHTGQKDFKCSVCKKKFARAANLAQHMTFHRRVKEFKCAICDSEFLQAGSLRRHMLTHTGLKKFKCSLCGRKFALNSHLTRHIAAGVCSKRLKRSKCKQKKAVKVKVVLK